MGELMVELRESTAARAENRRRPCSAPSQGQGVEALRQRPCGDLGAAYRPRSAAPFS